MLEQSFSSKQSSAPQKPPTYIVLLILISKDLKIKFTDTQVWILLEKFLVTTQKHFAFNKTCFNLQSCTV